MKYIQTLHKWIHKWISRHDRLIHIIANFQYDKRVPSGLVLSAIHIEIYIVTNPSRNMFYRQIVLASSFSSFLFSTCSPNVQNRK